MSLADLYLNSQSLLNDLTGAANVNINLIIVCSWGGSNTTFIEIAVLMFTLHDLGDVKCFIYTFFF